MDTVLGLAMTPTTVGWVMAEGRADGCPTVSGDEFGITRGDAGLDAVSMAASASAVAARARAALTSRGDRLHGVGVTWSDEAAVGAALLLESLADAGFDNVVPVRFSQAAASLTSGIGRSGERPAVCVIEPGLATLVLYDGGGGDEDPIVTACPIGGTDDVIGWLADAFGARRRRPEVLMMAGSMRGMDRLGRRLESKLSVPVFVQAGAQQALARGAALALAPHADLAGAPDGPLIGGAARRSMPLAYAGALTMLAGGAVTFVASLSAALSLQLGPGRDVPDVRAPEHMTVARVAVPAAPPAAPAPPPAAPGPPAELPEEPVEFGSLWDGPAVAPEPPAPPPSGRSLLDRFRERLPRLPGR
ncbi:hypothetical protein BST28_11695 [Mycolicibacter kumamotonensis]|uniref:DUF7159 domain-containing protein n=1 Tax=Mycolicibacter kumamotonensis TaxID=354243 RepID=A0A1X0E588_9MYCO|nr:hypothetical protein [Mycolicibacter kumamotonensis]ORA79498.1 hypothetical protein BST28_11695 [Mycolicibacter kumamotonensis]